MLDPLHLFQRYQKTDDLVTIELSMTCKFLDALHLFAAYNQMLKICPVDTSIARPTPFEQPLANRFVLKLDIHPTLHAIPLELQLNNPETI